jgi:hypothetical protein
MLSAGMTALLLLHVTCVVLHVAMAAAWFGIAMRLSGESRAVVRAEPAAAPALAASGLRGVKQMGTFLVLALVFGLGAVLTNGGFESYSWDTWWNIHVSIVLLLLLIVLHYLVVAPGWRALSAAAGSPAAQQARGRLAAAVGVGHLVWFVILVLMFWSRFTAALAVR